jgi:hypothetical protein
MITIDMHEVIAEFIAALAAHGFTSALVTVIAVVTHRHSKRLFSKAFPRKPQPGKGGDRKFNPLMWTW